MLFSIVPLGWHEWKAVIYISLPVIAIDEVLKLVERMAFLPEPLVVGSDGKAKKEQ